MWHCLMAMLKQLNGNNGWVTGRKARLGSDSAMLMKLYSKQEMHVDGYIIALEHN